MIIIIFFCKIVEPAPVSLHEFDLVHAPPILPDLLFFMEQSISFIYTNYFHASYVTASRVYSVGCRKPKILIELGFIFIPLHLVAVSVFCTCSFMGEVQWILPALKSAVAAFVSWVAVHVDKTMLFVVLNILSFPCHLYFLQDLLF